MDSTETAQAMIAGFFPSLLGLRLTLATRECVRAEMLVREDLCTVPGILHGGAIMAMADTLGAVATVLNMPEGARTTTIESKTNFFAPGRAGTVVTGECLPLNLGRRFHTWQTTLRDPAGKLLAIVTQTQLVDAG